MPDTLTPVLTDNWDAERAWTLPSYESRGGYGALRKALGMDPAAIVEEVKESGLRGRGGAGFLTGMKWSFIPQDNPKPKYLVVNADESEPGTCKDIPLMMASPHTLVEGVIISSYAIRANQAFIYIRGEVLHVIRRVQAAVAEAYAAGHLGKDIHGSGYDLDVVVHAGAGAYICGEETALLEGLEGRRGQPRLRPPFPAVAGLYASPTVINNVESIASVPSIVEHGASWFASMGTEKSKGYGIFSLSGHVERPGQFEAPLGITLRELIDLAGGIRQGHELKFWTPARRRRPERSCSTAGSAPCAPARRPEPCRPGTARQPARRPPPRSSRRTSAASWRPWSESWPIRSSSSTASQLKGLARDRTKPRHGARSERRHVSHCCQSRAFCGRGPRFCRGRALATFVYPPRDIGRACGVA
jgi:hypothetical protein